MPTVKLFANLKEAAGTGETDVEVDGSSTVEDVLQRLVEHHPELETEMFDDDGVHCHLNLTVDGRQVDVDASVECDSEVAVYPPVTGGER